MTGYFQAFMMFLVIKILYQLPYFILLLEQSIMKNSTSKLCVVQCVPVVVPHSILLELILAL